MNGRLGQRTTGWVVATAACYIVTQTYLEIYMYWYAQIIYIYMCVYVMNGDGWGLQAGQMSACPQL